MDTKTNKKLNDEIDQKRIQNIALIQKNRDLDAKLNKEKHLSIDAKSKAKKKIKELNKKIGVLTKVNKELKVSYNNQTVISDLYLEDSKKLQQEVQQHSEKVRRLKDLMSKNQEEETKDKNIILVRQNDNI